MFKLEIGDCWYTISGVQAEMFRKNLELHGATCVIDSECVDDNGEVSYISRCVNFMAKFNRQQVLQSDMLSELFNDACYVELCDWLWEKYVKPSALNHCKGVAHEYNQFKQAYNKFVGTILKPYLLNGLFIMEQQSSTKFTMVNDDLINVTEHLITYLCTFATKYAIERSAKANLAELDKALTEPAIPTFVLK